MVLMRIKETDPVPVRFFKWTCTVVKSSPRLVLCHAYNILKNTIGGINGKYGLFPLSKATTVSLDKADQERIQLVLANKKMVKKSQDKKNRSASVAFKDGQAKKPPTTADPAALLALQQQLPPQNTNKRATRRRAAPAADV